MANSTSNLDLIATAQAQKEVTANAVFDAASPATLLGRRASTTSGLTWGYYGGKLLVDGAITEIANGTITLPASSTCYLQADRAGALSLGTGNFTPGRTPLYTIVTGTNAVTSYTDHRILAAPLTGRVAKSVAGGSDVTLNHIEARCQILELTGALTANISVILPAVPWRWVVLESCSGAYTVTLKTSGTSGIVLPRGRRIEVICDGTNIIPVETALAQEIAYSATIAPDAALGERVLVAALTGNLTVNAPANPRKGARLEFLLAQDATGGRTVTWDAVFKKAADGAGTANQKAATAFVYDGAHWLQLGGALAWY